MEHCRPIAQVVPAMLHAVDRHVTVATACQMLLDRFVRSAGIADEDHALAVDQVVKLVQDDAVQP
jgi:hypothetical protein